MIQKSYRLMLGSVLLLLSSQLRAGAPVVFENKLHPEISSFEAVGCTLARELPRQALIVAAVQNVGVDAIDRVVDFSGIETDATIQADVHVRHVQDRELKALIVQLRDQAGTVKLETVIPAEYRSDKLNYVQLAPAIESITERIWTSAIEKLAGVEAKPVKWVDSLTVPDGIEERLERVNPHDAFQATQTLHAAISADGESPQRLAALARAYANLGESTRHLCSGHSTAFFARAMIYAERAVRKAPKSADAQFARAYALALTGFPSDAESAIEAGRTLAGDQPIPGWVERTSRLAAYDTRALFDQIGQPNQSPLTSYFVLLTTEFAEIQSIVINAAELARNDNPDAPRIVDIELGNTGVGPQHELTETMRIAHWRLIDRLADDSQAAEVQASATEARKAQYRSTEVLALFDALDRATAEHRQLARGSVYASILRDSMWIAALRNLYFAREMLSVDATLVLRQWWPYLKDHRYAALIGTFDKSDGEVAGNDLNERLQATQFRDVPAQAGWIARYAGQLNLPRDVTRSTDFIGRKDNQADATAWDFARMLWHWSDPDAERIPILSIIKGKYAQDLATLSPNHPSAISQLILNDWENTKDRVAEIEEEHGSNPQVAMALARAYRMHGREADAQRVLEWAIKMAPDAKFFDKKIESEQAAGNEEAAVAMLQEMLKGSTDFGLQHSAAGSDVGLNLMRQGKFAEALPILEEAAQAFSQRSLQTYAACLTELEQFEKAEAVMRAAQQRYPAGFDWYHWCQQTGKGDLDAARKLSLATLNNVQTIEETPLTDYAIVAHLEGNPAEALAFLEKADVRQGELFRQLLRAVLELEAHSQVEAIKSLQKPVPVMEMPGHHRGEIYRTCHRAMKAAILSQNTRMLIPRTGVVKKEILDHVDESYRGNACYLLGRACELRGSFDDAKWWYSTSRETRDWTFRFRGASAMRLRALEKPKTSP